MKTRLPLPRLPRGDALVIWSLGALVLLNLLPNLLARTFPFNPYLTEFYTQSYPYSVFFARWLRQGVMPLWTDHALCGFPLYAFSHAGLFYPLNFRFLPPWPAVMVFLGMHEAMFAIGTYLLSRRLGHSLTAAALTGALALGMAAAYCQYSALFATMALIPWLYLFAFRLGQRPGSMDLLATALVAALMVLAGHTEVMVYAGLGLVMLAAIYHGTGAVRLTGRGLAALAVAGALGLILSWAQWLPLYEYLGQSIRSRGLTLEYYLRDSQVFFHPFNFVLALVPVEIPGVEKAGSWALLFSLVQALIHRGRRRSSLLILAATLVLAMNAIPGLPARKLAYYLPVLDRLVRPSLVYPVLVMLLLLVAGSGLESILGKGDSRGAWWTALALAGLAAAGNAVGMVMFGAASHRWVMTLLPLALAGLLLAMRGRPSAVRATIFLVWLAAILDPLLVLHHSPDQTGTDELARVYGQEEIRGRDGRFALLSRTGPFDRDLFFHLGFINDTRELWSLISVPPRRIMELMAEGDTGLVRFQGDRLDRYQAYTDASSGRFIRPRSFPLLCLVGLRYVYSNDQPFPLSAPEPGAPFHLIPSRRFSLFENSRALPLAFPVHDAFLGSDEEARRFVSRADGDRLAATVALARPGVIPAGLEQCLSGQYPHPSPGDRLELLDSRPGQVKYELASSSPGLLFESTNYFPGWRAFLDGAEVPLLRADYAFRAVFAPAGTHRVVLRFEPPAFRLGLWISLAGLAAWIAAGLWAWSGRARGTGPK